MDNQINHLATLARKALWAECVHAKADGAYLKEAEADRIIAAAISAAVKPLREALRLTGPNSDGEIWLHVKAPSGKQGGVNLSHAVSPEMDTFWAACRELAKA